MKKIYMFWRVRHIKLLCNSFVFGPKRPLRIVSCETYCNLKGVLSALWKVFHVKQSKNVAETSFEKRFELKFFFSAWSAWLFLA